jgi:hypothetical protein
MSSPLSRPPRPPARMIIDDLEWSMPQRDEPRGAPRRLRVWMFPDGTRLAVITDRGPGTAAKTVVELTFASLRRRWPDDIQRLRIIEHYPPQVGYEESFTEVTIDNDGRPSWRRLPSEQMIAWCGMAVLDDMPELPPDPELSDAVVAPSSSHARPDGPGIDDRTVICGYPSASGDALVVLESPQGEWLGPLPHYTKDSPEGYSWGYIGTGPSDLARSILVAVLGRRARCKTCDGTGNSSDRDHDAYDSAEIAMPANTRVAGCARCPDGIDTPWVNRFRREYVARWPIDQPWRVTGSEIRAWLTDLNSRPQL